MEQTRMITIDIPCYSTQHPHPLVAIVSAVKQQKPYEQTNAIILLDHEYKLDSSSLSDSLSALYSVHTHYPCASTGPCVFNHSNATLSQQSLRITTTSSTQLWEFHAIHTTNKQTQQLSFDGAIPNPRSKLYLQEPFQRCV